MVEYSKETGYAYFNGKKYMLDKKTGYYLNSTTRERLHRAVYIFYNGVIGKSEHIHHLDEDKNNNEIRNLIKIDKTEHLKLHMEKRVKENKEWFEDFYKKGIVEAVVWHKSKEGHDWHKQHYETHKEKLYIKEVKDCMNCGKEFNGLPRENSLYCSNACKSAYRRKLGLDLEERTCKQCGSTFKTNKYNSVETCSRSCSNRYRCKKIKS